MDLERALVTKIVRTGRIDDAISKGIRVDLFADEECRDLFQYMLDYNRQYKSAPSLNSVKTDRPKFEWEIVEDPLDWLIDKFIVLCKKRLAQEMVEELARACDDPKRAENIDQEFLEVGRKLATLVPSTQVSKFKEDMDKRISEYEVRAKKGEMTGIPFGFPWLDDRTGGIQRHEFATVAGFSGIGKSTFLQATTFNFFSQGKSPLYISLEMEAAAILRKWDAMAGNLKYKDLKQLKLSPAQIKNWRDYREQIQESVGEIPVIDSIRRCTPDHIFAEAVRHKPDVIVIDYLSLMSSSRPSRNASVWQSLTEITQDLKQVARTLKIPILAAAQTNRASGKDGAELDNIGYSLSVVQDSDIVIGLFADEEMKNRNEMEVRLRKNRDGAIGSFKAIWDHENMIYKERNFFERPDK